MVAGFGGHSGIGERMKIEDFVASLRQSELRVRVARRTQEATEAGTAVNLRALIDHRRERDELSSLIARHPDLVARILVRAWEVAEIVADPLDTDGRLGNTLRSLGAEGGV